MVSSKLIGKNPREIASTLVENFSENDIIQKLEIAGPGFINIYLKNGFLNEEIKKVENEKYDFSFLNTDKTVIIDYSSPNIAKRMHTKIGNDKVAAQKEGFFIVRVNSNQITVPKL